MSVQPSPHALKRYRQHHPGATRGDLQLAVGTGIPVDTGTAHALCGRPGEQRLDTGSFVLAPDRRGLFVLVPLGQRGRLVVTYLRFGPAQEDFALRSWPSPTEPEKTPVPSPLPDAMVPLSPSPATATHPSQLAGLLGGGGLGSFECSDGLRITFGSRSQVRKCLLDGFVSESAAHASAGQALLLARGAEHVNASPLAHVFTMLCTTSSQRPVWVRLEQRGQAFLATECATPRNADDWDDEIR